MKKLIVCFLIFMPLFFWGLIWLRFYFNIDIIPDVFLRSGHGKKATGLSPEDLFYIIATIAMLPGLLIGSVYIIFKKLWWWFAAYIIIAGIPLWLIITYLFF